MKKPHKLTVKAFAELVTYLSLTVEEKNQLKELMEFCLRELTVWRQSYTVQREPGRNRLVIEGEDVTAEVKEKEKWAKRFLRRLGRI